MIIRKYFVIKNKYFIIKIILLDYDLFILKIKFKDLFNKKN